MIPFTYLIKHVPTNRYYYGVKFEKGCHPNDFWTKYFTSSKKVKGLIKRYGKKSFIFEIRKTFKTQQQARNWENKVLRRMKVIHRDDFLNETDNISTNPKVLSKSLKKLYKHTKHHRIGKKQTEETKRKMSISKMGIKNPRYGKKHSKAFLRFLSKISSGKNNPMYGRKGKNSPVYGRKHSKKTIQKMSIIKYKYWAERKSA
jgi:hypothetical protein